jgi:molybdenum cofactor cytidylyltransferase
MIVGLILAAGKSERMGRLKPLLPLGENTVLGKVYNLLKKSSLDAVRVILGHQAVEILEKVDLPDEEVVINHDYEQGMLSSIKAGLKAAQSLEPGAILLCPVDHPDIDSQLIELLISGFKSSGKQIVVPVFNGKRGHPVIFGRQLFKELLAASAEVGARQVVRDNQDKILEIEVKKPGVVQDIDTPEDYERLKSGLESDNKFA